MPMHEYYEELCALLPLGQLSSEEYGDLVEHQKTCTSCRHASEEYSAILDRMPIAESDVDEKTLVSLQGDSYRDRFLKRALAEGVPLTAGVFHKSVPRKQLWPRIQFVPAFAVAAVIAIAILSAQVYRLTHPAPVPPAVSTAAPNLVATPKAAPDYTAIIAQLEKRSAALESETTSQSRLIEGLNTDVESSRSNADSLRAQLAIATQRLSDLQAQSADANKTLTALKSELERARNDKDSLAVDLVTQQAKITDLVSELKQKDAIAERERQLTAVAGDVRELMGARNLHIVDVSDVDGRGRSKKSFGRMFLAEGKTMIFYAFDLSDRGNPAKVSFQAWGQLEGRQTTAKNLGVFYVDDHAQKRWVLKVNDPEKLQAINSVFVTVEPLGGVDRPTGKRLLYAYFGTQPNHP